MKSVLISIQPEWCMKIFNYEKTIEIRKHFPQNIKLPFQVFVYETLGKHKGCGRCVDVHCPIRSLDGCYEGGGAIIGSFVCDKILNLPCETTQPNWLKEKTCLSDEQYMNYLGHKDGYGWHVTEPKLFEFYRDIKEFAIYGRCAQECSEYDICMKYDDEETRVECPDFAKVPLKRAPQSWCYVEEI